MKLNERLSQIQQELKAPKGQMNTFGGYKYRSCEDIVEAVKPLLSGLTLILSDEIVLVSDRFYVKATAKLSDGTEILTSSAFAREPSEKKGMSPEQITGATSSYARKYALNGLFAIDDTKDADTDEFTKRTDEEAKPKFQKPVVAAKVEVAKTVPEVNLNVVEPSKRGGFKAPVAPKAVVKVNPAIIQPEELKPVNEDDWS